MGRYSKNVLSSFAFRAHAQNVPDKFQHLDIEILGTLVIPRSGYAEALKEDRKTLLKALYAGIYNCHKVRINDEVLSIRVPDMPTNTHKVNARESYVSGILEFPINLIDY